MGILLEQNNIIKRTIKILFIAVEAAIHYKNFKFLMKKTLAEYLVLWDDPIILGEGQEDKRDFFVPSDYVNDNPRAVPVIQFYVEGMDSAEFEIDMGDLPIAGNKVNKNGRVLQIAFRAAELDKNEINTAQIRVVKGKAKFASVVLWMQRNVEVTA